MSDLGNVIDRDQTAIIDAWVGAIRTTLQADEAALRSAQALGPALLRDIVDALLDAANPDGSPRAEAHGRMRAELGCDLRAVVDEFALLHDAVLAHAESIALPLTARDVRTLARSISVSVRRSVEAFLRDRETHDTAVAKSTSHTQNQLAQASRIAKLGFFDLDVRANSLELNEQMQKDWCLPSPSTVEMALHRVHVDDREHVAAALRATLYNHAPYQVEYRVARPDGSIIWVEASGNATWDEYDEPAHFFGTARDVSDQVGQRKWWQAVLDELPTPILMVEPNTGSHFFTNRAADIMYGSIMPKGEHSDTFGEVYNITDATGRRLTSAEMPTTRAARGEFLDKEEFTWHTDAGRYDIVLSTKKLQAMYGQPATVLCTLQDVTAIKTAQRTLEELVQHLEEESLMRDRFVSALSHDLRTPLAAANLSAQSISRHVTNPARLERAQRRITESLARAEKMIQDILDANRIKAGEPLRLQPCEVRLEELLQETVAELQQVHGQRVVLKVDSENSVGEFDPSALRRVVDNLVNNAVKYGDDSAPIELSLACAGRDFMIAVHNEGPPIAAKDQRSLFDPYYRAETAARGKHKGWGIGLTLVREISQAHGGSVDVRSSAKTGTTFTVRLPRRTPGDPHATH